MTGCFKPGLTLFTLLGLSACAALTPVPEEPSVPSGTDWRRHASSVASLDNWFLKGRIAIQTEQDSGSASLYWRQQAERFNLRVVAPLGQGSVELEGTEGGEITLTTEENQRYTAADAETLMQQQLGWSVPVEGLKFWVRGLPAPGGGITAATPDSHGRIQTLDQKGWHIEITDYVKALDRELPRRMEMVNDRFKLKLVVQDWEPADA